MLKRFLTNALFRLWLKPLWNDIPSIEKVRRTFGIADRVAAFGKRDIPVKKQNIDGVPVEWVGDTDDAKNGVIVYLHGGGFAARAPLADRRFCKTLSCRTGMPVILVAYRLAPEHRFPAGLNDCCQVYESLLERGITANRIVLVGHSAGANIALVLLMRAREKELSQPAGAVLLSAPTDMTAGSASAIKNAQKDPMQGPNIWPWAKNIYLGATPADNAEASPLFGDWSGLPPMHFHVSDTEIILDDSTKAAERARMAECDVALSVWHDVHHNFHFIDYLAEAKDCQIEISSFISRVMEKAKTDHHAANLLLDTDACQRRSA